MTRRALSWERKFVEDGDDRVGERELRGGSDDSDDAASSERSRIVRDSSARVCGEGRDGPEGWAKA